MAGLLDFLSGDDPNTAGAMDPRAMGLLGATAGMGAAYPPQPASRLPLARPSLGYMLSQAAGGYGKGYGAGVEQQQTAAKTYADQLANLNAAQMYNLRAGQLGWPSVGMPGRGGSLPPMAGGAPPPEAPPVAAPALPAPSGVGVPAPGPGQPTTMTGLASRNNNPGNLKFRGQPGATQGEGGFAKFDDPDVGFQALKTQIALDTARGATLESYINKYAPPSENDTPAYLSDASKAIGVPPQTPLYRVNHDALARFQAKRESGFTPTPPQAPGAPAQGAGAQVGNGAMVAPPAAVGNPPPSAAPVGAGSGGPAPAGGAPVAGMPPDFLKQLLTRQAFGVNPTPEQQALLAAGHNPYDLNNPVVRNTLQGAATKAAGIVPSVPAARSIPPQNYNPATGKYDFDTSALPSMQAGAAAVSAGTAGGQQPFKEHQAAFEAGLKVNTENRIEQLKVAYQTGQMPPDYLNPAKPEMPAAISPKGEVATSRGTVVPPPPQQREFPGSDAILKENANTQDAEKNFGALRGVLDQAESRLVSTAKLLQVTQSAGLNEYKAEVANGLRGAGLNSVADKVMSATDTASVKALLGYQTMDILGQLKAANTGTGGRILNSEFVHTLDTQYGPDIPPDANHALITQALGGIYQTRNMIDDYYKFGKPMGWRDAYGYESAYYSHPANSMGNMIDYAGKVIGPLKGQESKLQKFTDPTDKNLQMLPKGAHFLDANGLERIRP
jgi:hypothetical protein